jgi:tripartite-type tricarboxylate transporter receptor subunit TctC
MLHVPFKGVGPAMIALLGGEVDVIVIAPTAAVPQVEAGKARALAVLGNERIASLPNVPTAKEAGIDNFEALNWFGINAPARTPREIVNRLNAELIKIAAMPDTIEQIRKAGVDPISGTTPEQFSEFIKAAVVSWAKVIKEANIPSLD